MLNSFNISVINSFSCRAAVISVLIGHGAPSTRFSFAAHLRPNGPSMMGVRKGPVGLWLTACTKDPVCAMQPGSFDHKQDDKPGYVVDGHLSRPAVASRLKRPT